jgi:EAL and modified HD-GYP domain-containing signal transduction protein
MDDHSVLNQVALGYSPMIDRQRAVIATRLTIFPARPDEAPDAVLLLAALAAVFPAPATDSTAAPEPHPLDPAAVKARIAAAGVPPVVLNVAGEALLQAVMAARPGPHLMLEVPAFMATDAGVSAELLALHQAGSTLLLKGRPSTPLPAELVACFAHSIIDVGEERRQTAATASVPRTVSTVQSGVRTLEAVDAAFLRGAIATLGWPIDDPLVSSPGKGLPQDVQVVMELIDGVDRGEPAARLEGLLKKDPTLAFRLLRYLNSPAFGLSVEISSFGHALMIVGYQRLKRWLVLLLASSVKGINAKPVMFAALRRGLLMEELARHTGDAETGGEMFICGVFSLLDRLLKQTPANLFKRVPVPERVQQALLGGSGPFHPYLELVRAIEAEALFDIRECTDKLFMTPGEVNRALLAALAAARALD